MIFIKDLQIQYYFYLIQIGRPTKIGKMYKQNGAYFVGNFVNGKAQGSCCYIMPDGSYFQGDMNENMADC